MATFGSLPPELRTLIFEDMRTACARGQGSDDAAALALVSKECLHYGRSILYEEVDTDSQHFASMDFRYMRAKAVMTYPHLRPFVRILNFAMWSLSDILAPDVPREEASVQSLYCEVEGDLRPLVGQLMGTLRQCTNLQESLFEDAAPDELLHLLGSLSGCKHLHYLTIINEGKKEIPLVTGGLEINDLNCGSRTNWLTKFLAELSCLKSLTTLELTYSIPYTPDEPREQPGKLTSIIGQQQDLSLLSLRTVELRCGYNTNFFFQMFDTRKLVHLNISLSDGTLDLLCHNSNTFPNVTYLSLEQDSNDCFRLWKAPVLWLQFPMLIVFEYYHLEGSEHRAAPFDANRTDLSEFTLFLDSLPPRLRHLKLIDQEYFYEANMTAVDRLWKGDRMPHLLEFFLYRDYKIERDEEILNCHDCEDIFPFLESEFFGEGFYTAAWLTVPWTILMALLSFLGQKNIQQTPPPLSRLSMFRVETSL